MFEQIFLSGVETEKGGNDKSKQHPVFVEDKQKAPPNRSRKLRSRRQRRVREGSKLRKLRSTLPPARDK